MAYIQQGSQCNDIGNNDYSNIPMVVGKGGGGKTCSIQTSMSFTAIE